ncbi:MAG: ATP-binding cassette domain-containing protein [Frankiaceae bacterium]|nr:ATP-binding cassette domain-containing protein [Frankiaceae bacterium]
MTLRSTDVAVRVDGVKVAFSGRTVLHDFSVELSTGSQYALTGRSGSGKTTLLLLLAGLLTPDEGRVVSSLDRSDVLYVPQAPSLIVELTAAQNASLGLRLRGVPPAEALSRGVEQLRALGLVDADDALPGQLSGGMQQRVALARAMAVRPRLLLADEPTGSLDQATGRLVLDTLIEQAGQEMTLVVATHDPAVAGRFDHHIQLDHGRVA